MKNSYQIENDLIYFRRATKEDNMREIAELIYDTDPYIYSFWFNNNKERCIEFLNEEMKKEGFIFNYNNLYIAYDKTLNKIVGILCAIDKSVNLEYRYEELQKVNDNYKITVAQYIMTIVDEVKSYDNETIYIPNVCIDKSLRGRKIGTKLLGYYIKQMEKEGFNKFALDCLLHNLPAKNLYHSLGFREMKLINGFDGKGGKVDVVSFLRKKGAYLPEEFN